MAQKTKKTNTPRKAKASGTYISFEDLNARAHPVLLLVLEHWYPDGYLDGSEFKIGDAAGNPGKNGHGSLSFNIDKNVGQEFGGGPEFKGDIIALNRARMTEAQGCEVEMREAAADLQKLLDKWGTKPPDPNARVEMVTTYHPVVPVEKKDELDWDWFVNQRWIKNLIQDRGVPIPKERIRKWDYRDAAGLLMQCVIRWDGDGKKQIRPLTLDRDTWQWKFRHIPNGRPLYGLDRLAARPDAPVLITEGEKATDAGAARFPDYVVIAWCGGANSVNKADWTPLAGRNVVRWPDNDEAGRDAMDDVLAQLRQVGVKSAGSVELPDGLPDGWDLADEVPEGVDLDALLSGAVPANTKPVKRADEGSTIVVAEADEEIDDALARMNKKYFVAQDEKGTVLVHTMKFDPLMQRKKLKSFTFTDLRNLYLNQRFHVDGKKFISLGDAWVQWRGRPTFNGIIFDPRLDPGPTKDGFYNLWQGFQIKPAPGRWEMFKEHIFENLCRINQTYYDYFIRWCARMYQEPWTQGETAVAVIGEEGAGKGIIARSLGEPFGQHFIQISDQNHLVGKFNVHQRDAIFMFVDEGYWAGAKSAEGNMKRLITEPTLFVEPKGKESYAVPNRLHVMMASNNEWIVPAGWGARRFFVLEIGNKRLGDMSWFSRLDKAIHQGGELAAFLYDMLEMDLADFNVRKVVATPWLTDQKELTMPFEEKWWLRKLESGKLSDVVSTDWMKGETTAETDALYEDYLDAMKKMQTRYTMADNIFGKFLRKVFTKWNKKQGRDGTKGKEEWPDKKRDYKDNKRFYSFPSLPDCRAAYAMYTGIDWVWPKDDDVPM